MNFDVLIGLQLQHAYDLWVITWHDSMQPSSYAGMFVQCVRELCRCVTSKVRSHQIAFAVFESRELLASQEPRMVHDAHGVIPPYCHETMVCHTVPNAQQVSQTTGLAKSQMLAGPRSGPHRPMSVLHGVCCVPRANQPLCRRMCLPVCARQRAQLGSRRARVPSPSLGSLPKPPS